MKKYKDCPICGKELIRNSRIGNFSYLKCWGCLKMFTMDLLFELREIK